ncbi:MAG TPA: class I SAM-dependent methyltransferase [Candidatus Acidoferrum sp.]|nr:class I SAM-dependent methyltransferase [Methylomirabilota bacterium]HUK31432.1 class I SAM-dependent methyltransferase [Candidatus Acidoferrum sp.]
MNALENWFCGSGFWRYVTRRQLLPWVLHGADLGEHVLELGAGPGAATLELARLAPRVTCLEYDHKSVARLGARTRNSNARVVHGDAASLPFADQSFSSAIAILMFHHLKSSELQDRAFTEIFRVLRPGGVLLLFEIPDGWFHRVEHFRSTFVPLDPASLSARLSAVGFAQESVTVRSGGFRVRARRPEKS